MQVQGSILIRRKAKDAVSVSVSPESIALKRSDKQQTVGVTVGVTVGNTALPYYKSSEACFVCGTPKGTNNSYVVPDALKWSYDTRTGFVMKFTLLAGKEVNIDVKFDVTYYPQGTNNAPAIKWEKTVSIVTCKDGDKGDPGNPGTDGNGIASQESLFVATDKKAVASYGSVAGWSNRFPQPTEQKPYVWKCVKTTYTKKADSYSTPELVTIYQSGTNGNILRNASFTDESNMEAWVTRSQYSMSSGSAPAGDGGGIDTSNKLHGHNSYFDRCSGVSGAANYKDVLVQTVHHPNGGLNNIVSGQWHTFSFWAKRAVNVITLNKTVSATSYATANVYLKAGVRYAIRVQSTVSSASYPINTTVTPNGTSVAALTIKQTASGSKTDYLTPSTSGIHAIRSVVSSGTGTVISYAVDDSRDLSTYLAPSLVDTSSKIYVDGEERTPSADLGVVWSLTNAWSFHTLTFKAAASLTASVKQQLFFRLDSVPHVDLWRKVWICEPKLESGMMYTGYVDSAEDLKGIPGLIERTSEWVAGVEYHNDSNLTGGIRYRDIVTVTDTKGNFEIYVCQKTHLSTTSNAPKTGADSAEWLHVNGMRPIYTPLIIADNAVLRFGQTNRMLIMNSKQKVQGCFGGVENEATGYPLWIGGETAEKSIFKVGYDGHMEVTDGLFSGFVFKKEVVITDDNLSYYLEKSPWGYETISLKKTGSRIRLKIKDTCDIYIPCIYPNVTTYTEEQKDLCRSYIGTTLLIYVESGAAVFTGNFKQEETGGSASYSVKAGYFASLTCCVTSTNGKEDIYWLIRTGKQN